MLVYFVYITYNPDWHSVGLVKNLLSCSGTHSKGLHSKTYGAGIFANSSSTYIHPNIDLGIGMFQFLISFLTYFDTFDWNANHSQ